jgi:hypothetical protein
MTTTSRREFLLSTAAAAAAIPVLARCGESPAPDDDAGARVDAALEDGGVESCASGAQGDIAGNHGHSLSVPRSDVEAGVARTYDIRGSALHGHTVEVSGADFATLAGGGSVVITSSDGALHTHQVTVRCA